VGSPRSRPRTKRRNSFVKRPPQALDNGGNPNYLTTDMGDQTALLTHDPAPPKTRNPSAAQCGPILAPRAGMKREDVLRAIARLTIAERARLEATEALREMGVIRGRRLAEGLGQAIAAAFYGVEPPTTVGFDLETDDGTLIHVRTFHCTAKRRRTAVDTPHEAYDLLLALRLDAAYAPVEAIEVPREVVQEYEHQGRLSWTKRLARDPRVRHIPGDAL